MLKCDVFKVQCLAAPSDIQNVTGTVTAAHAVTHRDIPSHHLASADISLGPCVMTCRHVLRHTGRGPRKVIDTFVECKLKNGRDICLYVYTYARNFLA